MGYKLTYRMTPHQWSREGRKPEYIVIHTTEGQSTWKATWEYMMSHPRQASYHELCSPDEVMVFAHDNMTAAHVGYGTLPNGAKGYEANLQSIGLCMWNTGGGKRPAEQTIHNCALRCIVKMKSHNLGIDRVIAHREADPARRLDPSRVEMAEFKGLVLTLMEGGPVLSPADEAYLKEEGRKSATVPITPGFALFDAIMRDNLLPNGPEVYGSLPSGARVAMRSAESTKGEKWTYYIPIPPVHEPWGKVERIKR